MSIRQTQGEIISKEDLGTAGVRLVVQTPGGAELPQPGQFAMLRPASLGSGVFLGRPISYLDATERADGSQQHDFYIKVYGAGSAELAGLPVGARLDLMSGLGTGFPFLEGAVAMVAGGVGIAPIYHLAMETQRRGLNPQKNTLYYGGRSGQDLPFVGRLSEGFGSVRLTTEDGSEGSQKGYVTVALSEDLGAAQEREEARFSAVLTCGPTPMMRAVAERAQKTTVRCVLPSSREKSVGTLG